MRKGSIALIIVILLISSTAALLIAADERDDRPGTDDGYYRGFDAGYRYTTSGSDKSDYASHLTEVVSDSDTLIIQSAIEGYPLRSISDDALSKCGSSTVFIPDTVTSMSPDAVANCRGDTVIFLGELPEGLKGYGDDRIVCAVEREGMILESDIDSGTLRYIVWDSSSMILGATGKGDLVVPERLPSADSGTCDVRIIGCESFRDSSFSTVTLPGSVDRICTRAFYGCDGLRSISLPEGIISVEDEAFRECVGLENIDLMDADFIGFEAFRDCRSFTEIVVPDSTGFVGEGAFYICSSAARATVGDGIDRIPPRLFGYCGSLESVELGSDVTSVGRYAFHMCQILEDIDLSGIEHIGNSAFSECRMLPSVDLPSIVSIGSNAFSNCRSIGSLVMPECLEVLGSKVFLGCRMLDSITFLGPMPDMEPDALSGSDFTIHVSKRYSDTWSGYGGEFVID